MKSRLILFIALIFLISTPHYVLAFPTTKVSVFNYLNGSSIESLKRMVPIEIKSSQQLKSVKLQINDKKPRTICRDNCWDFKIKKPIPYGLNNIKIILEDFEEEKQEHKFLISIKE